MHAFCILAKLAIESQRLGWLENGEMKNEQKWRSYIYLSENYFPVTIHLNTNYSVAPMQERPP